MLSKRIFRFGSNFLINKRRMSIRLFEDSGHTSEYAQYRPTYPDSLFDKIAAHCGYNKSKLDIAVDVGCGNGQATLKLKDYFKQVIGTDVSPGQIEQAKKYEDSNITFRCSQAEHMPFIDNESVDLVLAAQAYHWFDHEKFHKEAKRILKKNASIIIVGYGVNVLDNTEADRLVDHFYSNDLKGFWDDRRKHIDNHFQDFNLPFNKFERNGSDCIERNLTVDDFVGYIGTWSAWKTYLKKNPNAKLLDNLKEKLKEIYGDRKILVKWPIFILFGKN